MLDTFNNSDGRIIVDRLIDVIHENRLYLSEIDGKIGDGDHGINMDKGFQMTKESLTNDMSMGKAFNVLGRTLLLEIGGSMGPLYGQFFKAMAKVCKDEHVIDSQIFLAMLEAAYVAVKSLGEANPGDKTLVDTLDPAVQSMRKSVEEQRSFPDSLTLMVRAAEQGWKSTEDMVANLGRSSRLGERSRGVLDAGATSCFFMLKSMANSITDLLRG